MRAIRGASAAVAMVLMVTGEIPGPILHCGRCHTLDTGTLIDLLCPLPDVSMKFVVLGI